VILVVSSNRDAHAIAVLKHLSTRGIQAHLLDLSEFPSRWRLLLHYDHHGSRTCSLGGADGSMLSLSECRVVWWRRPQMFVIHPEITRPSYRTFAFNECWEAFAGLWQTLDVFWINHPSREEVAGRKVYQLQVAQDVALDVPETLITNGPDEARAFVRAHGIERTIYKTFSATREEWRETRLLKPNEVALLDNVCYAPVIFQAYVPADVDLRVTIVGPTVFAAAIHSQQTPYPVDYRMEMAAAKVEAFDLPVEVLSRLRALMDRLGLVYGAIDMRLTPEGQYVFLEINPSGEWRFIEERTGQEISEAFAELLALHDNE
jgi:glutathione synthase/RimK-type ligase-like ATP-grasp enzyme